MIAGQQITPTLRLSRPLGHGAMGSVWVADQLALGTQVAVKFMSPAFAEDALFVERFRREAMAAAQIKSPHVVQVFDHGITASGAPYIVMELLEGEDLNKRVRRAGPLAPREVANIVGQAARALHRAHQMGIIHRDIKADNIFLMNIDGEVFVKVLDFGVAKQLSESNLGLTSTGSMVGTPLYMSPEQLLSAKHVDARSDLWSLAVVAYYAMTGRYPFNGETLGGLCVAVHTGGYPLPGSLLPGLPPAVDAWFHRALQRAPEARFPSAREMADELARAVGAPAASEPRAMEHSAPVFGAPQGPLSADQRQSASSYPALGSSGASGRTFSGTSRTGASSPTRRAPLLVAVAALALGVGALLLSRRQAPSAIAEGGSATAAAAPSAPATHVEPTAPSSSSAVSGGVEQAVAPAALAPPQAAASASAASAPRGSASARPSAAAAPPLPKGPAAKTANPPKDKDTIGF